MFENSLRVPTFVQLVLLAALGLNMAPATAAKPSWAGGGKAKHDHAQKSYKQKGAERGNKRTAPRKVGGKHTGHFRDHDRTTVRGYYGQAFHRGKACPPGLAKKRNGCMPPGQAKKRWRYGQPLPRETEYHDLPRRLLAALPPPPEAHRYVRVASDIVLIVAGSRMVIDAIEDLGRLQ
jgi:Ni/Co efflux regulator RcnB